MSIELGTALRLAGMFAATAATGTNAQILYYVDDDAPPGGSGSSWQSPFRTLDDALAAAAAQVGGMAEIRIAGGTYIPNPEGGTRASTFACEPPPVHSAVSLWLRGGYAGYGSPVPNAREIDAFRTVLSGDRLGNDGPNFANYEDNCFHVVTVLPEPGGETSSVGFDGLTIRGGAADLVEPNSARGLGAGVLARRGKTVVGPTFLQARLVENRAVLDGGGGYFEGGVPRFNSSEVARNAALRHGGGIWIGTGEFTYIADSVFSENTAVLGGGIFKSDTKFGELLIWRSIFAANAAIGATPLGGGICALVGQTHMTSCVLTRNTATGGDGGAYAFAPTSGGLSTVNDCTFTGNTASLGGAISSLFAGYLECTNVICWNDGAQAIGSEVFIDTDAGARAWFVQCDVQGGRPLIGTSGPNNVVWTNSINLDPRFTSPDGPDGNPETWRDNDLRLRPHSPCIDSGNGDRPYTNQPDLDVAGQTRRVDDRWTPEMFPGGDPRIDMGAYEFQGSSCAADCSNNGLVNVVDFVCFQNRYATGDILANCDQSTVPPVLNVADFICFMTAYAAWCS